MRVALTIDAEHADRPHRPDRPTAVFDILAAADVRATVFVQGRWAEAFPDVVAGIAADGHRIGNHSHHHARLTSFTKAGIRADTQAAETAIRETAGVDPRPWYRWPFGDGAGDASVAAILVDLGYRPVGWHVDPEDWEPGATGGVVADRLVEGAVALGDGAVLLIHSWPDATAAALPSAIERLHGAGARFVTLDELEPERLPTEPA